MSSPTRSPASAEMPNPRPLQSARPDPATSGTPANQPWYREERWLAVALSSLAVAGLALLVPGTLRHALLVVSGVLAAIVVPLLIWREIQTSRRDAPREESALGRQEARMQTKMTWLPLARSYDENDNGKLDRRERRSLPDSAFAFPAQRDLPLVDVDHVRDAIAHFASVKSVSDDERELAAANIVSAAAYFGLELPEGWHHLAPR